MARQKTKICLSCNQLFRGRVDARTCSERCRKRLQRAKIAIEHEATQLKDAAKEVVQSVESHLTPSTSEAGFIATPGLAQRPRNISLTPSSPKPASPSSLSPVSPVSPPSPLTPEATLATPINSAVSTSPRPTLPTAAPLAQTTQLGSLPISNTAPTSTIQEVLPPSLGFESLEAPASTASSTTSSLFPQSQPVVANPTPAVHTPGSLFSPDTQAAGLFEPSPTAATTASLSNNLASTLPTSASPAFGSLSTGSTVPGIAPSLPTTPNVFGKVPPAATALGWTSHIPRPHFALGPRAKLTLAGTLVITLIAIGIYLLGNQSAQNKANPTAGSTNTYNSSSTLNSTSVDSFHLNVDTFIDNGHNLTVSGAVLIQNAAGDTPALQVNGDINATGSINAGTSLSASGGATSLSNAGLTINNTLICTANGCSTLAAQAASGRVFTGDADTLNGQPGSFYQNSSNQNAGTLSDQRLSSNVALLNANNAFTGNNTLSGANTFSSTNTFNGPTTLNGTTTQTGSYLFQPTSNSLNAFQLQNSAGTSNLLIADTTHSRIAINQATANYALDVNGDVNVTTGGSFRINGTSICTSSGCTASSGSGSYIQNNTSVQTANFAIQSANAGYVGGVIRAASGQTADLLDLNDQNNVAVHTIGATGNVLIQPSTNSTTAFQLLNANATSHLIVGDTFNARVAIAQPSATYTLDVGGDINSTTGLRVGGTLVCASGGGCTAAAGSGSYIQNGTTLQSANFAIQSVALGNVVAVIKGASGQTADLLRAIAGDSGNQVLTIAASGATTFKNDSNSTAAFAIQNSGGNNYLLVNTSGATISLGDTSIASTIQIGNTTGAVAQTINIGNNATGSSTSAITIGDLLGTSATTIQGGTGASAIGVQAGTSGTISIGTTNVNTVTIGSTSNTGTLTLGQSTAGETINIGNGNVANTKTNTINIGATATSTGKDVVTIGSTVAASTLTLQGGNTASAISIQSAASGTISLGTSGVANTVQIGNTTGAVAQTINIGNNATGSSTSTVVLGSTIGTSPVTIQAGTSGVLVKPANGTTAFQIQNSTSGSLFTADTSGMNLTLDGANNGTLGAWSTNANTLPATDSDIGVFQANGYIYVVDGANGTGAVYYAKLNADGSAAAWTTSGNSLPAAREAAMTVTANGYAYVIGGNNGGCTNAACSTVYYTRLNADGSIGVWKTSTSPLPAGRYFASTVAYNGYVYVLGGEDNSGVQSTSYYAKLSADGTVGAWATTTSLPAVRGEATTVTANGYIYLLGGTSGSVQSTVYYSKVNSDGTLGSWTTNGNTLTQTLSDASAVVANGYIYEIAGTTNGTNGGEISTVYYAQLNSNGSTGAWNTTASIPSARARAGSIIANGYVYEIGGQSSSNPNQSTVYYASTSRIKAAGSIDLVGLSGGDLTTNNGGGSITAGNITGVGDLQIQGQANFAQSLSVTNVLTVSGSIGQTLTTLIYQGGADASGSGNSGTGNNNFNSVAVSGRYMYAASNGSATACSQSAGSAIGCELQVYDISNPSAPTYVGGADASGSTNSGTGNSNFIYVTVSGHYAYVGKAANATTCSQSAGSAIGCELQVYDISNPSAPTYVGGADASGSTNSGTGNSGSFQSVAVDGRYAYVAKLGDATACSSSAGSAIGCELQVYDISNPASPTYLAGVDASGSTGSGTANNSFFYVTISGRYAYVANGGDPTACSQSAGSALGCELQVYDVSSPASPAYVGGADASGSTNSGTGSSNSLYVTISGRYAYVGKSGNATTCAGTAGSAIGCELQVYSISKPSTPTYVGGADASGGTNTGTDSSGFNYIFVAGRYAYVAKNGNATACSSSAGSAIGCELQAYDISNPASPTYLAGVDASGSTGSGTANSGFTSMAVSGRYIYLANQGNATACSGSAGSAIGCELQVYDTTGIEATAATIHSLEAGTLQVDQNGQVAGDFNIQGAASIGQSLAVNGTLGVAGSVNLDSSNSGTLSSWATNANALPAGRIDSTSVTANGYAYVLGGDDTSNTPVSTVYYAKLNADGSAGSWTTSSNALPANRFGATSVTSNGYIYEIGGTTAGNGANSKTTVYYAKLNSDGSTGGWATAGSSLPSARYLATSVIAKGYVYVMGGFNSGDTVQSTVYYAKLNADGSVGSWQTNANALPAAQIEFTAVTANDYIYALGGYTSTEVATVYYAKVNADGSTGSWTTNTNALPTTLRLHTSVVANGYVYVMGGLGPTSTVYYAQLNSNGSTGSWFTNANALPAAREYATSVIANGYVYVMGGTPDGSGASGTSTVYYASTSRVKIGGSIDLVGLSGGDLTANNGGGGSIVAGNITGVGDLQIQGNANFANSVSVTGNFSVQNSSGNLLSADSATASISLGQAVTGATSVWQTNANALPAVRKASASVSANGYVYEIGGDNGGTMQSTVYYAKLNANGSTGAWSTNANALPATIAYGMAVTYNGYVYVLAGTTTGGQAGAVSTVYFAKLNADGSTGVWQTNVNSIPAARWQTAGAIVNGYVYIIGGQSSAGSATNTVYYAKFNPDGSTGAWSTNSTNFPVSLNSHSVFGANGYIYSAGGIVGGSPVSTVRYAPINSDGSVGTWNTTSSLPAVRNDGAATVSDGYAYFIGGDTNGSGAGTTTYYAQLNSSGTLGSWSTNTNNLPIGLEDHTSIAANGYIYAIGGENASGGAAVAPVYYASVNQITRNFGQAIVADQLTVGNGLTVTGNTSLQAAIDSTSAFTIQSATGSNLFNADSTNLSLTLNGANSGQLGTWATNANALPSARYGATSVVANGYVYEIGGDDSGGTPQSTVYYAKINADGSVGTWSTAANALPAVRAYPTSVASNGYVYVMGGFNGSVDSTTVYYSKLNNDGSVGSWNTTSTLPAVREEATSVVANGYVYVMGGTDDITSFKTTVYYAKLNADGTTGTWQTNSNNIPTALILHSSVTANGYVYVMGGYNGSTGVNTVYYAKLNNDGSTGTWSTNTNNLPAGRNNAGAVVVNGYAYIVGGPAPVYYAKLNSDGSTGVWSTNANSLPNTRDYDSVVTANGYVYALGGSGGGIQSTVLYASAPRVQIGGSVDLVGLSGGDLTTNNGGGGNLTAGNITGVGDLQIQGNANFAQSLSVVNALGVGGNVALASGSAGALGTWSTATNALPNPREQAMSVFANGYIYELGGCGNSCSAQTTVYYAKVNADGSPASWTTSSNPLPNARQRANSITANGYIYVIAGEGSGGDCTSSVCSAIYYAKLNSDGSTGSWITNAFALGCTTAGCGSPAQRYGANSVTANGYVYVMGGWNSSGTAQSTVYYAKLNSDGSTGAWATTTALTIADTDGSAVVANGYVYQMGGFQTNNVYYAPLNNDGTIGSWTSTTAFSGGTYGTSSAVSNGYVYMIAGIGWNTNTWYAKLNNDGTVGAWATNSTTLPAARARQSSVVANGYVYVIGGENNGGGSSATTIYYASTARVQVAGSLDLVGLQGSNLSNPGDQSAGSTGGSITAGNILGVGTLQIQGAASFAQGVSILNVLNVAGDVTIGGNLILNSGTFVTSSSNIYVTSLPGSPVDGQEVYYKADATNGVIWHLRYNSSEATYHWEYLGGGPLVSTVTGSTSWTFGTTTFPVSITLPLSGDYEYQITTEVSATSGLSATEFANLSIYNGSGSISGQPVYTLYGLGGSGYTENGTVFGKVTGQSSSGVLKLGLYKNGSGGTWSYTGASINVRPVRVN